jgi:hypothetical protein
VDSAGAGTQTEALLESLSRALDEALDVDVDVVPFVGKWVGVSGEMVEVGVTFKDDETFSLYSEDKHSNECGGWYGTWHVDGGNVRKAIINVTKVIVTIDGKDSTAVFYPGVRCSVCATVVHSVGTRGC